MRRSRPFRALATVLAATLGAGCATTGGRATVRGQMVEVETHEAGPAEDRTKGELIAASSERLVVLGRTGAIEVPLPTVKRVQVRRGSGLDGQKAWRWTLVGSLVTSLALGVSCGSVEGSGGCGGLMAVVAGTWLLIGGLSASSAGSATTLRVPGERWEELRGYARFPQGLPEDLDPAALGAAEDAERGGSR